MLQGKKDCLFEVSSMEGGGMLILILVQLLEPPFFSQLESRIPEICCLFASVISPSNSPVQLYKPRNRRIAATIDGDDSVPTLTPVQSNDLKKPRKQTIAAIIGGVSGALLVIIVLVIVYICLMRVKRFMRRMSETESSVASPPGTEIERVYTSNYAGAVSPSNARRLQQLTLKELETATSNFSQSNIIGEGTFGLVYKGLLQDGSIVAIKRCLYIPVQSFHHEVIKIARANNKHLVRLVGYYEDNDQHILVYDYIPNGNLGNHLYDNEGLPTGKLNTRQRLQIALGAAKGLEYLHSLVPPLLHLHFTSNNVLLDEKFTAKVSDFGLSRLVSNAPHSGASSSAFDCFLDPELYSSKKYSAESDVYSFGVFLLELISGRKANGKTQSSSDRNLVLKAKECRDFSSFFDKGLGDGSMNSAKQMMVLALQCLDIGLGRPSMRIVVEELERIQERELSHLELGEEIADVTLGSELFK